MESRALSCAGISSLVRLKKTTRDAAYVISSRSSRSVAGNLIWGRQLRPALLLEKWSPARNAVGKREILRPVCATAEGSDSAGDRKVTPLGFVEKYPALVTGFFFFMWYFLNVIFNIINKKIYIYFPYPYFVSVVHLLVGVIYCLVSWSVGLPKRAPIDSTLLKLLIPVAICHAIGHVMSNVSFAAVAVSFTHTIKALEPFFNAAASQFVLGQQIPLTLWLSLAPVVIGVSMASLTELSFNWTGFISAMVSNISFTYRSIYSKKAMGFRKVDPDRWEFANEDFQRGRRHQLKNIKRRKPPSQPPPQHHQHIGPYLEVGAFGFDSEINRLRRDKNILMMELVKLRQEQQNTRAQLHAMEKRLRGTEQKQQQMMTFLAKAIQNPTFIQQLIQQKERRKELEEAMTKKRRRPINKGPGSSSGKSSSGHNQELSDFVSVYGFEVPELGALALEMQAFREAKSNENEDSEQKADEEEEEEDAYDDKELNEDFWDELHLQGRLGEDVGREDEDVNILAERIGFLGSSPK